MANEIGDAKDGLASILSNISGLRVLDYPADVVSEFPAAVIMFESRDAVQTLGSSSFTGRIKVVVLVSSANTEEAYDALDQFMDPLGASSLEAAIETDNTWYEKDRPLMTDHRSYRLFDTSRDAAVLDIALRLSATHGPVTIGDTKEGGFLCIRVNPTMNAAADGNMRNAYGATDEAGCWSRPSHWMDYYGPVGDEVAGYAILDHPDNFRYPTTWHVRGYGLFAPNCWMFKPDHRLDAGDSMTFRWRVVIHSGDTESADVTNRFLDYVDGPRSKWEL